MQFLELKNALKDFTIFSLTDIKSIDNRFHRRRLNEWQDKGYIKKVIRNYYLFTDLELNENVLYEIANKIYSPSYISFEMALSHYHLIPESVYGITSATTRRTYTFKTPIGQFNYRTVGTKFFFGYELINYKGKYFKLASMEKAILDYLYINPHIRKTPDFAALRLNAELFLQRIDEKQLYKFLDKFAQKTLTNRLDKLMEYLKNA